VIKLKGGNSVSKTKESLRTKEIETTGQDNTELSKTERGIRSLGSCNSCPVLHAAPVNMSPKHTIINYVNA